MAILRPDLRVDLVESDRRKAGFLLHAAAVCACPGVTVIDRRAEEVGRDPAHRAAYDLAGAAGHRPRAGAWQAPASHPAAEGSGRGCGRDGDGPAPSRGAAQYAAAVPPAPSSSRPPYATLWLRPERSPRPCAAVKLGDNAGRSRCSALRWRGQGARPRGRRLGKADP